jgi:hypothetical protein
MSKFFHEVQSYALYIAAGLLTGTVIGFVTFYFVEFLKGL